VTLRGRALLDELIERYGESALVIARPYVGGDGETVRWTVYIDGQESNVDVRTTDARERPGGVAKPNSESFTLPGVLPRSFALSLVLSGCSSAAGSSLFSAFGFAVLRPTGPDGSLDASSSEDQQPNVLNG
jgi:hypothetical protein